jgi:hypothetical protein
MTDTKLDSRNRILWTLWSLCVATGVFFVFWTPLWTLPLADGAPLWIWRVGSLQGLRPAIIGILLALPVLFLAAFRAYGRPERNTRLAALAPLGGLPLVGAMEWAGDLFPDGVMGNVRFFLPLALVAWSLARFWPAHDTADRTQRPWLALLILPVAAFYAATCYYAARTVGASAGDELCYILMADSLHTDHTADMKRAWARHHLDNPAQIESRDYMHLAENARDGHWYSWHPFGLPLLLAPFWPLGPESIVGRSLGMGLIAAAGVAGLWLLCRRLGASPRATLLAVVLLCGSVYWTSFASRVLTEVPGAVLLIWIFWAVAAEEERPWGAMVVAALSAVYSAFVHLRFLPLGLLGAGFFGLAILLRQGPWRPRLLRLVVLGLLLLIGYGVWFATQYHMYEGSAQPISGVLLSYPRGIWAILVDRFGAAPALPALYGLLAAQVVWWRQDRRYRLLQIGLMTTVAACAVLNCSNIWVFVSQWDCTPGRYLFAAVPLLTPGLAVVLTGATRPAVTFFLFLGLVSVAVTGVYFFFLPGFGAMVHPLLHLTRLPDLLGLMMPFAAFLETSSTAARLATLLFASCMVGASYVLLRFRGQRWTARPVLCLALVVLVAVAAHRAQNIRYAFTGWQVTDMVAHLDRDRMLARRPVQAVLSLKDLIDNPPWAAQQASDETLTLVTADLGVACSNNIISLPRIPDDNDWLGRPMRWATIMVPFKPQRGDWLLRIDGAVTGRLESVRLAIREGSQTLSEIELPLDSRHWKVEATVTGRRGDLYVLAWAKGEGAWCITSIKWLPWSRGWGKVHE